MWAIEILGMRAFQPKQRPRCDTYRSDAGDCAGATAPQFSSQYWRGNRRNGGSSKAETVRRLSEKVISATILRRRNNPGEKSNSLNIAVVCRLTRLSAVKLFSPADSTGQAKQHLADLGFE
jgi:hypothetical protein